MYYTMISYKPHSEDYCRGCHMASYRADFQTDIGITKEDLVKKLSEHMFADKDHGCGEAGYGFLIFQNGINIYDSINHSGKSYDGTDNCLQWEGDNRYVYDSDEYWEHFEELDAEKKRTHAELTAILAEAQGIADKQWAAKKEKERIVQEVKDREEAQRQLAWKKKEIEALEVKLKGAGNSAII
jgi:hypothetical protein